ncbi:cysteine desulfurase [Longispora fulva]|uniref:Cysteine desulfurase n=1 Tax=Longispora fulva TaxID=619741 RepID=A0A8J7KKZ2_9ACTN|nr:cysteine desulfurase family protein [Longispora fulva]MBG6138694.1 cysteine desulfurase [Longispora fulva]GIG58187.1 cysteine desulfurase [Longispora fulva]
MVYLDHAATSPMLPEVLEAYVAAATAGGNASSLHCSGRKARRLVEESRERVAAVLGARPGEVVFTAGGTESDNLAVKGIYWARRDHGHTRVLASAVEHKAVIDAVEWLERHEGAEVTWLEVDELGRVHPEALEAALGPDVALATVMWANNEVGTVQPVAALAAAARAAGVPLHTDAVQAVGQLPVDFTASGAAALTLTGHKLGGPTGVGALLLDRDAECTALLHGGGQERDVRSGTLDVAGIVAFAKAVELAGARREIFAAELAVLRDEMIDRIRDAVPCAVLNGDPVDRLPANVHFSFPGCEGDALLMLLDAQGIECSTGSACSAGVAQPSHVLMAMGADSGRARSSLRFSLGHGSVKTDIDALVAALPTAVERARRAGKIRR